MKSNKTWNVYLIHHSHTDIGYTQRQQKLMRYHYDYIKQAIDILDDIHENGKTEYEGFVWQCENHWQIENFYEMADKDYCAKLEHYISTGEIGVSGNYLNMTELVSEPTLNHALGKMQAYGKKINHPITAGMGVDINGVSWGYADALYDHGIRSYYAGLHPHHGMFPLYKKMIPFYWETPKGNKILVWNGEHYYLGNELFMAPLAGTSYVIKDEYTPLINSPLMEQNHVLNKSKEDTKQVERDISTDRIARYLDNLEDEGYPYDIVPLLISGTVSDNAPPNKEIAQRVNEWNKIYDGKIVFKMVNLEQFFDIVEKRCDNIPTYSGDWTDWWADGVGSTPAEVKVYRESVRKSNICNKLDPDNKLGNEKLVKKATKQQMLYAEHTWGYSSSVSEPWDSLVSTLELTKGAYAINANTDISKNLDQVLAAKGEITIKHDKPQLYIVCNPHEHSIYTKAYLYIEFWEYINGIKYDVTMPIEVIDLETGEKIPYQVKNIPRATQVEIEIFMEAKEERKVRIQLAEQKPKTVLNHAYIGSEGVEDLMQEKGFRQDEDRIETDHFIIKMKDKQGIYSIINKTDNSEVMREDIGQGAFAGVYEITDIEESACKTRQLMGRNRKSKATRRYESILKNRRIIEKGDIYTAIELDYSLEGTRMYTVFVKAYKHQPKIEAMVRIHKESRLEPENLYVSLPFTAGEDSCTYIDKTGCIIRPGIDQLPGTCQDFYLIQSAVLWQSEKKNVAVITKDAPLISIGGLEAKPVVLCNGNDKERNKAPLYSWPMNNYWETNFKVDLGGFYEFAYTLLVDDAKSPEEMYQICEMENEGLITYYTE